MTPEQRVKALEHIEKKLAAKAEKKGKDLYCKVSSMYSGNRYYLFRYKRLHDVRIVYAPPESIGNYGEKSITGCGPVIPVISRFYGLMYQRIM